jgi:uncharacterized protein (DUF427 family)
MKEKLIKVPGPDHATSIERNPARIVVSVAGRVIADTFIRSPRFIVAARSTLA